MGHRFFFFGDSARLSFSLFLSVEIFMEDATGAVRHVRIFGERFHFIFHLRRNLDLTASTGKLSRPDPIAVVVILEVFDVLQPLTHFIVSVSLSHSTARPGIEARVSYKERTGCGIRQLRVSARYNPAAPNDSGKAGVVPAAISYHYTIVPAHGDSRAIVIIGRVVRNH